MPAMARSLRVLMVAASYLPNVGGLETHVFEVGRRLAREGVTVTILTTDLTGRLLSTEEAEGMRILRVRAWPAKRAYYFAPGIYRVITTGEWDLVHCQGYHNLVPPLAMLAACHARIPFLLTLHSGGDASRWHRALRRPQWTILRPLVSRASKVIAVSEFEAEFFRQRLRLPAERIVVIPNGTLNPNGALPPNRTDDGGDDGHLIVSVGRLVPYKGHQRVIAALPEVLEQVPDVRLRIVGTGPYEPALRQLARKLGVADRVEFCSVPSGDWRAMASVLARADLVTLLSEYESQGIAAWDALALRRPVLVACTSALRQLAHLGLARAVPLNSPPAAVASAIVSQLRQPLVPRDITLPTWDGCASSVVALYRGIMRSTVCAS